MELQKIFNQHLTNQFPLLTAKTKILLAVSGGMDSMVLLELLIRNKNFKLGIAHCNYQLRKESNEDAAFVKAYCDKNRIPFFLKTFETKKLAKKNKKGIQEIARELRYAFFNEICHQEHFDFIVTAHHQLDSAESILFNLIRGTGAKGVAGIKSNHHNIIRPLLPFSKEIIQQFAHVHDLKFREDSSNKKNKYARNKLRNKVFPSLLSINKQAIGHIVEFGNKISLMDRFIIQYIESQKKKIITQKKQTISIDLTHFVKTDFLPLYLYYLIPENDLNVAQQDDLIEAINQSKSGTSFIGHFHTYVLSRNQLSYEKKTDQLISTVMLIDSLTSQEFNAHAGIVKMDFLAYPPAKYKKGSLYFNAEKIKLPITLRGWKKGDSFKPLGLNGNKKLSDFFIDKKLNPAEKKNALIIENGDAKIIGVFPYQIDERFKINPSTKSVVVFQSDES